MCSWGHLLWSWGVNELSFCHSNRTHCSMGWISVDLNTDLGPKASESFRLLCFMDKIMCSTEMFFGEIQLAMQLRSFCVPVPKQKPHQHIAWALSLSAGPREGCRAVLTPAPTPRGCLVLLLAVLWCANQAPRLEAQLCE